MFVKKRVRGIISLGESLGLYILFQATEYSFFNRRNSDESHYTASKVIFYKVNKTLNNLLFYR